MCFDIVHQQNVPHKRSREDDDDEVEGEWYTVEPRALGVHLVLY